MPADAAAVTDRDRGAVQLAQDRPGEPARRSELADAVVEPALEVGRILRTADKDEAAARALGRADAVDVSDASSGQADAVICAPPSGSIPPVAECRTELPISPQS